MRNNNLPKWYGLEKINFIYHGDWSDAEIEYRGIKINSYEIEDCMVERYREYCEENGIIDENDSGFNEFMLESADEVYELCDEWLNLECNFENIIFQLIEKDLVTDYESLTEFAKDSINWNELNVATHILEALQEDTADWYIYNYSMGTLETPSGVKCFEDIEHLLED